MKKRVFLHSNFSLLHTGFGKASKALLSYLYKTNKYEIFHYCGGLIQNDPQLERTPWKSIGCLPADQQELQSLQRDPAIWQKVTYGDYFLDKVISEIKPDIYIGAEDIWAFSFEHHFWNKIPSIIWTTLDSLPLLPYAIDNAAKIKDYFVWSNFAEKEFKKLGINHVKTVHGPVDTNSFYRFSDKKRLELRDKYNIPQNAFVIGFVFRNQLRKNVDKLLEGYSIFKSQNPQIKNTYLLLHTNFSEGWDIPRLVKEYNIAPNEVLTTYVCRNCKEIEIKFFDGQDKDCRFCGVKGSPANQQSPQGNGQITVNVVNGASEDQLNEVYNLMSVYVHPFTSGGQEIPIQEAKLTELVTLVTDYSCGEEMCEDQAYSLPLDYAKYREIETQFIKAATNSSSIAKQLLKIYNMDEKKSREWGQKARSWVLKNYSIDVIGKYFEDFIDNLPENTYDFKQDYKVKDINVIISPIEDETLWLKKCYNEILHLPVKDDDSGLLYWKGEIAKGMKRIDIENYMRQVAHQENQKNQKIDFADLLIKNDKKHLAVIQPNSIGDLYLLTSLFKSLCESYPKDLWNFYLITNPQYFEIFEGNQSVDKLIPYMQWMDNLFLLEGIASNKGYFDVAYQPFWRTQRSANYTHNGISKIALDLKEIQIGPSGRFCDKDNNLICTS